MDLDEDGEDEIIVARGAMSNPNNAQLMWFDEVEGERYWQRHTIASIWESGYSAPHNIKPYIFETDSGTQKAVTANKSRREIFLFLAPEDLEGKWKMHRIGSFPMSDQSGVEVVSINGEG